MWPGNQRISRELQALPRGGFEQNLFRAIFQNMRANDLGRRPEHPGSTVQETIVRAVELLRLHLDAFEPHIDWTYLADLQAHAVEQ